MSVNCKSTACDSKKIKAIRGALCGTHSTHSKVKLATIPGAFAADFLF